MALTTSNISRHSIGGAWLLTGNLTVAGNYVSGGYSFTPASLGLGKFVLVNVDTDLDDSSVGFYFRFIKSTNKIAIYNTSDAIIPTSTLAGLVLASTKPTFTVKKEAILATSELGLSADAATATVNNNGIAADLVLTPNGPVGTPTVTVSNYGSVTGDVIPKATFQELTNGSATPVGFVLMFSAIGV